MANNNQPPRYSELDLHTSSHDDRLPRYCEVEPYPGAPITRHQRSRITSSPPPAYSQKAPARSLLRNPFSSLLQAFQSAYLDRPEIAVLDASLCLDFCSFMRKLRGRHDHYPVVAYNKIKVFPCGGHLLSETRTASDQHVLLHTSLHVWAPDMITLWDRVRTHRLIDTSYQPCPHLNFADHAHADLLCPTISSCESFFMQAHMFRRLWLHCDRCATSCVSQGWYENQIYHVKVSVWHDLGTLRSPSQPEWVALAGKEPEGTASQAYSRYQSSVFLRDRFDRAPRTMPKTIDR
ncbi:hypothetical protein ANO11243_055870 [Dothideomycetidae sp. 11243]|nr:hypothetical protein ANO11243_055870 [fungal sp. No.11243]